MNVNKLVLFYLNNFLDKLSRENRTVFILVPIVFIGSYATSVIVHFVKTCLIRVKN